MKPALLRKLPVVVGAAVLLTCGTAAAAYALVADSSSSPADTGNTLPIDDNHRSVPPTPAVTGAADDSAGRAPAPRPARTHEATHAATHEATEHAVPEPGDDNGTDAPEVGDDHGGRDDSSGSGSRHSGGSDDSGHGGDDD